MHASTPDSSPAGAAASAGDQLGYGARFIHENLLRIVLVFAGLLLPLLIFASLVEDLSEKKAFFFDAPIMLGLHHLASPTVDGFFVVVSRVGYQWGVLPVDAGILLWLILRRSFRDGLFFGLAVIGSLGLNLAAKFHFARARPDLWQSLAPETTFSFPSGHAMGSVTLGVALTLLMWNTRWRWLTFVLAATFVLMVGMSRVYLGVHYPSDILAGWAAGTAWVVAMYQLVVSRAPPPPEREAAPPAQDQLPKA